MKQTLYNHIKNIPGWKTKRRLIAFAVDDYGNVRLSSIDSRRELDRAGLNRNQNRFDKLDTLETATDLGALYDVLTSVKDRHGKPAVFTPYALPCNIDFHTVVNNGYSAYARENLPVTFERLSNSDTCAYGKAWELWKSGMDSGIMVPQFHGREHLNLKVFYKKLRERDEELLVNLQQHSYTGFSSSGIEGAGYTAAFAFEDTSDLPALAEVLETGMDDFESVFGFRSVSFTPPAQQFPPQLEPRLNELGIRNYDKPFFRTRHVGGGKYKKELNIMKYDKRIGLNIIVRNVVFEPTENIGFDSVGHALKQIEAAFFWNKPAIISSHRVNFCGYIDPENREKGLGDLKLLLSEIVRRWPDVEFVSIPELGKMISDSPQIEKTAVGKV